MHVRPVIPVAKTFDSRSLRQPQLDHSSRHISGQLTPRRARLVEILRLALLLSVKKSIQFARMTGRPTTTSTDRQQRNPDNEGFHDASFSIEGSASHSCSRSRNCSDLPWTVFASVPSGGPVWSHRATVVVVAHSFLADKESRDWARLVRPWSCWRLS